MRIWTKLRQATFLFGAIFIATAVQATTYYVDYSAGSDSNDGQSKSTPWKYAPGMNNCTAICASTTPQAGDRVILKGGVTWQNDAFSWQPPSNGTSTNPAYYGVDTSWYAGSSWSRPIFNLGNAPPSDNLYRIILLVSSNLILDNFEITNIAALHSPGNGQTAVFDWGGGSESYVTVQNMYIHGWIQQYFSAGTGDLTAGSSTVTNYVPYSYSKNLPTASWGTSGHVKLQSLSGGIPLGNNTPTVTSVSGSGPYTVTFTNTAGGATKNCTGCVIQLGDDPMMISAGVEGPTNNDVMQYNVIDGSDTVEAQLNPYGDCGLSEGNNNICVASGTPQWRLPNIWRDNVIRYVANAAVGECTEWSGNLIEYIRLSTNPTAHTNAIECVDDNPVNNTTLFYGNVIRHTNNPNPKTPTGRDSIGLGDIQAVPKPGETTYIFNNVMYDTLQNAIIERGGPAGIQIAFNNSGECGPSWELTHNCVNPVEPGDIYVNNHFITSNSAALGSCSGYTCKTNLVVAPATASSNGYTSNQVFAFSPTTAKSPTVGAGTSIAAFCTAIGSAGFPTAAQACQNDTPYAVGYNATTHSVIIPSRKTIARPAVPDIGAYQFSGNSTTGQPPAPPSGLTTVVQ